MSSYLRLENMQFWKVVKKLSKAFFLGVLKNAILSLNPWSLEMDRSSSSALALTSSEQLSSTSINRLQDFKKSSTRLRLMVQRTLHIPSFKRLQRTEKSEKCCSSSCKSISHLFWSEFLRVLESHQQSSFLRFRWRFFNFHIPHHLPVLIIVRKVFKRFPCFTQGNTDMLDNLMDFSPRDKNKLIFSSRAAATHHGSLRIYKWVPFSL